MISEEDLVEIIWEAVRNPKRGLADFRSVIEGRPAEKGKRGLYVQGNYNVPYTSLPAARIFLSEYDIKKVLRKSGKTLRVPSSAILSPLALDWLDEKGIEIIRG